MLIRKLKKMKSDWTFNKQILKIKKCNQNVDEHVEKKLNVIRILMKMLKHMKCNQNCDEHFETNKM